MRLRENARLKEELAVMATASAGLFEQIEALCDDEIRFAVSRFVWHSAS